MNIKVALVLVARRVAAGAPSRLGGLASRRNSVGRDAVSTVLVPSRIAGGGAHVQRFGRVIEQEATDGVVPDDTGHGIVEVNQTLVAHAVAAVGCALAAGR